MMPVGQMRCAGCGEAILGPHACPQMTAAQGVWFVDVRSYSLPIATDDEAFLVSARVTMKKCQVGTNNLGYAHDILADCYGTIGRLISMVEALQARPGTSGEPA